MQYHEVAAKSEQVFYSQSIRGMIDVMNPDTGRSALNGETLDELRQRYPDAEVLTWPQVHALHDELWKTPWVETTEEEFNDMLNVLPPIGWARVGGVESFKMSEMTSGTITSIFARCNGKCYVRQEDVRLPAATIAQQIRELG